MPTKRDILHELTVEELKANADYYGIKPGTRRKADLVDALARSRKCRIREVLADLYRDRLKDLCGFFDLDTTGREKSVLVERLLEPAAGRTASSRRTKDNSGPTASPQATATGGNAAVDEARPRTAKVPKKWNEQGPGTPT